MSRRLITGLVVCALAVAGGVAGWFALRDDAPAAPGLLMGLQDDRMANPGEHAAARMALAAGFGVQVVRVDMRWDLIAPRRPADATDPQDPAYDWTRYDALVAAAGERGLRLLFTIWGTPAWAGDASSPDAGFPVWSRRPRDPGDAGSFAQAAARRYAPRSVHMWEAWNEPNIPLFLRPQCARRDGRWVPVSPAIYAAMLSAVYRGIHVADPDAVVAGGVTAPAGDKTPVSEHCRVPPREFAAALGARGLRPPMDIYSHHPYPITRPRDRNNPRANYVDLYNLDALVRTLDRTYLKGRNLWLTEFGYATRGVPQYPLFVSEREQADFLRDAVDRVRARPRVRVFVWYLMQDHPGWASGLLDQAGAEKPAAAAFRQEASRPTTARGRVH